MVRSYSVIEEKHTVLTAQNFLHIGAKARMPIETALKQSLDHKNCLDVRLRIFGLTPPPNLANTHRDISLICDIISSTRVR